jgi:hypothetical protein
MSHYHLFDTEGWVAGRLGWLPGWDSKELSLAVGVNPDDFERHTALGDCRWQKAVVEAAMRMFPSVPRPATE